MYICYTICDDGQRYFCSAEACVMTCDPQAIEVVLANLEATAEHAAEEGAQAASALLEAGAPPATAKSVKAHSALVGRAAQRMLRRSRLRAEAFLVNMTQRVLVCDVREAATLAEAMLYTRTDPARPPIT